MQRKYLSKKHPDAWILLWLGFPLAIFVFIGLYSLLLYDLHTFSVLLVSLLALSVGLDKTKKDKEREEAEEVFRIQEEQRIEIERIEAEKAETPKRRYNREEKHVPINQVHKRIGVQNHAKKRDNRKRWRYNR